MRLGPPIVINYEKHMKYGSVNVNPGLDSPGIGSCSPGTENHGCWEIFVKIPLLPELFISLEVRYSLEQSFFKHVK